MYNLSYNASQTAPFCSILILMPFLLLMLTESMIDLFYKVGLLLHFMHFDIGTPVVLSASPMLAVCSPPHRKDSQSYRSQSMDIPPLPDHQDPCVQDETVLNEIKMSAS